MCPLRISASSAPALMTTAAAGEGRKQDEQPAERCREEARLRVDVKSTWRFMGSYKGSFKGPFKGIYRDSIRV